jgi:hypothetical protein
VQFIEAISNPKLPRQAASLISQLRTTHIPLNSYLQIQTRGQHKMPSMQSNGRDGSTFPTILPRLSTRAVGAGESHQMQTQHENTARKPEISARAQKTTFTPLIDLTKNPQATVSKTKL